MKGLIKAEWFKLSKSLGFKLLCLWNISWLYYLFKSYMEGWSRTGYMILVMTTCDPIHHMEAGSVFAAIFFCYEFFNSAWGESLLCGYSRQKVFWSKMIVFLGGMCILFLFYVVAMTIGFSCAYGFGDAEGRDIFVFLSCGILGYITIGVFIAFIAVFAKNPILTIGICVFISNNVLDQAIDIYESRWRNPWLKYTFLYQFDQLNVRFAVKSGRIHTLSDLQRLDEFSLNLFLPVMLITLVITLAASAVIFEKRNLK